MDNAITYDPTLNPDGASLPGVPLAGMTATEYQALPIWLQVSVDACPFYTVPDDLKPVLEIPPGTEILLLANEADADPDPIDEVNS